MAIDPFTRDRILACPHRGGVLPLSMQRPGCRQCELTECRAGRGQATGRVTLADCITCQADHLKPTTNPSGV